MVDSVFLPLCRDFLCLLEQGETMSTHPRRIPLLRLTSLLMFGLFGLTQAVQGQGPEPVQLNQFSPNNQVINFDFDTYKGEFINYETSPEEPMIRFLDQGREFLAVINEPGCSVVILELDLSPVATIPVGQGLCFLAQVPGTGQNDGRGELWAACEFSAGIFVIRRSNHTNHFEVVRIVRPTIDPNQIGLQDASSPVGIAFSPGGDKAFVSNPRTDSFWCVTIPGYDVTTFSSEFTFNGADANVRFPRSMTFDPVTNKIFASVRFSGNNTAVPFATQVGLLSGLVFDLAIFGLQHHDRDLLAIDPLTNTVDSSQSKATVGTLMFCAKPHPETGKLVATHMDARNGEFIGEGSFPDGRVTFNRLTIMDAAETAPPYTRVVELDTELGTPIAMPTHIAFDSRGRIFVAGFASNNVAMLEPSGDPIVALGVGANPAGLLAAIDRQGSEWLYVYLRGSNSVERYSLGPGPIPTTPNHSIKLFDPAFISVKEGRKIFNDASNSGFASTGCFSCHPHGQRDLLAWDLSKSHDIGTVSAPPAFFKDEKRAMTTQTLQSLEESAPYHWRGEQKDLEDFNGAFVGLLQGNELGDGQFSLMKRWVFSIVFPANSFQNLNRTFSDAALAGANSFENESYTGDKVFTSCTTCHSFPHGSDNGITEGTLLLSTALPGVFSMETAHMKGFDWKTTKFTNVGELNGNPIESNIGIGFLHSGVIRDGDEFADAFTVLSQQSRDNIKEFQREWDTATPPAANYSEFLARASARSSKMNLLVSQAERGWIDVAVRGRIREQADSEWVQVGFYYDRDQNLFISDRVRTTPGIPPFSSDGLVQHAQLGNFFGVVHGVPYGSGQRIGVDQDRDRFFDGDELAAGLNPFNPDTDGDGLWDGEDPRPKVADDVRPTTPPLVVRGPFVDFATTNIIKISYETDLLSSTHAIFGTGGSMNRSAGDPMQLPHRYNEWKRYHTVYLRLLEDGQPYNYQIITQGQGGGRGDSAVFTQNSAADPAAKIRVTEFSAAPNGSGAATTFTISVKVLRNNLQPFEGATVHLEAFHLDPIGGGVPPVPIGRAPIDTALSTDVNGDLTFTWTPPAEMVLAPGDLVQISLPMARRDTDNSQDPPEITFLPGLEDTAGNILFSFPESTKYDVTIVVP